LIAAWFGRRGFASVVFGFIILQSGLPLADPAISSDRDRGYRLHQRASIHSVNSLPLFYAKQASGNQSNRRQIKPEVVVH
jgi:hypothetical protein